MEIKDIDKSKLFIEIIFSLWDEKQKLAEEIAEEYKISMRQRYKDACVYLAKDNILIAHAIPKGEKSGRY